MAAFSNKAHAGKCEWVEGNSAKLKRFQAIAGGSKTPAAYRQLNDRKQMSENVKEKKSFLYASDVSVPLLFV